MVSSTIAYATRAGEMAQQVQVPANQDWHLEFDPWNSCRSERRELIPQRCPLMVKCALGHVCFGYTSYRPMMIMVHI